MRLCSVKECGLKHLSKGMCRKHYVQFKTRGYTFVSKYEMTDEERFKIKTKLNDENGCIDWNASCGNDGYGRFSTSKIGSIRAHRYAYELRHGNIPDGLCVLHKCDRRICVNPDHLFLGTNQDNMTDMVIKKRSRAVFGSEHHNSKLKEDDVIKIKQMLNEKKSHNDIAKIFNVNRQAISKIAARITWKHIPFLNGAK